MVISEGRPYYLILCRIMNKFLLLIVQDFLEKYISLTESEQVCEIESDLYELIPNKAVMIKKEILE